MISRFTRQKIRQQREKFRFARRYRSWQEARRKLLANPPALKGGRIESLLIVPADYADVLGSRGDEAMLITAIAEARRRNKDCRIGIVTAVNKLPAELTEMGAVAEPVWLGTGVSGIIETFERYDTFAVLGADIMDGEYVVSDALRAWTFSGLAALCGLRAVVLGFSYSGHPAEKLDPVLGELPPGLDICTRDSTSKAHFESRSPTRSTLVADCAFLLPPTPLAREHAALAWIDEQRAQGRTIYAFNAHPAIFKKLGSIPDNVRLANRNVVSVMQRLSDDNAVAFLLLPNDFRDDPSAGDREALGPLNALLRETDIADRVFYLDTAHRAAELKYIVGQTDLLVTSRMHLGIAALSMGVPMWGINPQDKFTGLFKHFGLADQRLQPEEMLDEDTLFTFMQGALRSREEMGAKVRRALPDVLTMSERNFAVFDGKRPRQTDV